MGGLLLAAVLCFFIGSHKSFASLVEDASDGEKVIVLNYHKIDYPHISLSVPPEEFEAQMKYLVDHGYHSIAPEELYAFLEGKGELPDKPVLITFDDGYEDNYVNAYPVLKKYGLKATIFVVSGFMSVQPHYMTWNQLREMSANGISIQGHTVTHSVLSDLPSEKVKEELEVSKKKIEEEIGKPVEFLAYPTGTYNLHIAEIAEGAGYKAAFTVKYGNVDKASNVYALERVPVFQTENTYRSFVERFRYTAIFEEAGWIKN